MREFILALFLLGAVPTNIWAAEADIKKNISYLVKNLTMVEFANNLATDFDERIQVSPLTRIRIKDTQFEGSLEDILADLSKSFSIDWFEYNGVYFISTKSEAATRIIRLGDVKKADVMQVLDRSALSQDRFPISVSADGTSLSVTAPPKLVAIIEATVEGIRTEPKEEVPAKPKKITIRRGLQVQEVEVYEKDGVKRVEMPSQPATSSGAQ